MPDIFDELEAPTADAQVDVFDEVAPETSAAPPGGVSAGDLGRRVASGVAESTADAASGLMGLYSEAVQSLGAVTIKGQSFSPANAAKYSRISEQLNARRDELARTQEGFRGPDPVEGDLLTQLQELEKNPTKTPPLGEAINFMRDVSTRSKADYGVDPARDEQFISKVAGGLGSVVPALASGPAAPATIAGMMGEQGRKEAEEAGGTPEQQRTALFSDAAIGSVSEALLGVPALLRSAKAAGVSPKTLAQMARKAAEQLFKSSLREGTQESLEQVGQNLVASDIAQYDKERKVSEGVGQSFLVGAAVGGPVGGTVQVAQDLPSVLAERNRAAGNPATAAAIEANPGAIVAPEAQPFQTPEEVAAAATPIEVGPISEPIAPAPVPAETPITSAPAAGSEAPNEFGQTADDLTPRVITPEGPAVKAEPLTTGPHIISTVLDEGRGLYLTGDKWNAPHQKGEGSIFSTQIEKASGVGKSAFLIQDESGKIRVTQDREEAAKIAEAAGQRKKGSGPLQSEDLDPEWTPSAATITDTLQKIVSGEPVTVFHGSPKKGLTLAGRTSFTTSRQLAEKFAGKGGEVYEHAESIPSDSPIVEGAADLLKQLKAGEITAAQAQSQFQKRPNEIRVALPLPPTIKPGQQQGDLLAGTAQDPFNLAGEKIRQEAARKPVTTPTITETVDDALKAYGSPQEAINKLLDQNEVQDAPKEQRERVNAAIRVLGGMVESEARAEADTAATGESPGRYELLESLKDLGGLPAISTQAGQEASGELQRIVESSPNLRANRMNLFRKNGKSLETLREALSERGFNFDTPYDMLTAIENRLVSGKPSYGTSFGDTGLEFQQAARRAEARPRSDADPLRVTLTGDPAWTQRTRVHRQIDELPGIYDDQKLGAKALLDARSSVWAAQTGKTVDDYYSLLSFRHELETKGGPRGQVQIFTDGKKLVTAFEGAADISTLAHEIGHIFRQELTPEQLAVTEKWAGVKEGKWTEANEEAFATAFERYLMKGEAPTPWLKEVFEKFATWLRNVYGNLRDYLSLSGNLSPNIADVFDSLFTGETMSERGYIGLDPANPTPGPETITLQQRALPLNIHSDSAPVDLNAWQKWRRFLFGWGDWGLPGYLEQVYAKAKNKAVAAPLRTLGRRMWVYRDRASDYMAKLSKPFADFDNANTSEAIARGRKEFGEWVRLGEARDGGKTMVDAKADAVAYYATMSPEGQRLADLRQQTSRYTGAEATALGVHVFDGQKYRPLRNLGEDFHPRLLTRETEELIQNPVDAAQDKKPEFIDLLDDLVAHGWAPDQAAAEAKLFATFHGTGDLQTQEFFSSLDIARNAKLPDKFYDTSFDAYARWMGGWSKRMGQIFAFGQEVGGKAKTAFDRAREAGHGDKKLRDRISAMERQVYNQHVPESFWARMIEYGLVPVAGVRYLINTGTLLRNLVSGQKLTWENLGTAATLNAEARAVRDAFKAAYQTAKNVSRGEFRISEAAATSHSADLGTVSRAAWTSQFIDTTLPEGKYRATIDFLMTPQALIENFNRNVNTMAAMTWLEHAARSIAANPASGRSLRYRAQLERWRFTGTRQTALLARDPETVRSFLRTAVSEKQYSYLETQTPSIFSDPKVRPFLQFQKWGAQRMRDLHSNIFRPAFVGESVGGKTVRDIRPFVRFIVGTMAEVGTVSAVLYYLLDREPTGPTWEEIWNTSSDDEKRATMLGTQKLLTDFVSTGGAGLAGDYGSMIASWFFTKEQSRRQRDVLHPPFITAVDDMINVIKAQAERGWDTSALYRDVQRELIRTSPTLRDLESTAIRTMGALDQENRLAKVRRAYKDFSQARALARRFLIEKHGDLPAAQKGVRTENSEAFTRLQEALMIGDAEGATEIIDKFTNGDTDKMKSLKASVARRGPLMAAANMKRDDEPEFLAWAERRAPSISARVSDLNELYHWTAQEVGLEKERN